MTIVGVPIAASSLAIPQSTDRYYLVRSTDSVARLSELSKRNRIVHFLVISRITIPSLSRPETSVTLNVISYRPDGTSVFVTCIPSVTNRHTLSVMSLHGISARSTFAQLPVWISDRVGNHVEENEQIIRREI